MEPEKLSLGFPAPCMPHHGLGKKKRGCVEFLQVICLQSKMFRRGIPFM